MHFLHLSDYLGIAGFNPKGLNNTNFNKKRDEYYNSAEFFRCPSKPYEPKKLLDYAVNSVHFERRASGKSGEAGWFNGISSGDQVELLWPTHYIKDMSKTMLIAESVQFQPGMSGVYSRAQFFAPNHLPWSSGAANTNTKNLRLMSSSDDTHDGFMAFTAFDGSSHSISLTKGDEWPKNNARVYGNW